MKPTAPRKPRTVDARTKLLEAALRLIRANGYKGTSVEELCSAAGVTKGAFFHHFASKEALAVAAAGLWSSATGALFAEAPYHDLKDPLERVLGYLDFRRQLLAGATAEFTCLVGTMVQDSYDSNPPIREACEASIWGHAATLEADLAMLIERHSVEGVTAESLALHTQAVLQGAFILAKAKGSAAVAADSIDHLKRYFVLLFNPERETSNVQS